MLLVVRLLLFAATAKKLLNCYLDLSTGKPRLKLYGPGPNFKKTMAKSTAVAVTVQNLTVLQYANKAHYGLNRLMAN